ncbi:hypothetical protein LQG66_30500 [Bradyrhizobium ontarionense]|uniref:Uncharacterized protein n=1 Tax=Bradyrhizobium ontarionense TaxID=2898149 RepID=A0ABY3RPN6_9BRAD|nr:hypothetical protein [Bradyrhizobium sp. A19]UFZ08572.1 hypothetical protein LQG66_30500 [Bradyrhizobium sp. A19]
MIRHSFAPLVVAAVVLSAGQASAQSSFPAPLPGQAQTSSSPFPPIGGAPTTAVAAPSAPFPSGGAPSFGGGGGFQPRPMGAPQGGGPDGCMKEFIPLREEAEKRGKLIKAASDRHASPDEACKLIGNFGKAEVKMIKYVEAHAASCGIPQQIADQLKAGHKNTDALEKKVCAVAAQVQVRGQAGPSLSDVLGSSAALPEANATKKGGSTFDTLNGNVLTR